MNTLERYATTTVNNGSEQDHPIVGIVSMASSQQK
jgi:hypothetical protein